MATHDFCKRCPVGGTFNPDDQTCSVPDPVDGLPTACVGPWAVEKHARVRKYVDISRAVRRKFTRGAGGATYVDLFCGPGRARIRETMQIVDGSALAAARAGAEVNTPFSEVFVADANELFAAAATERLERIGVRVTTFTGTADKTVNQVAKVLAPRGLHFAFLDPYDLRGLPFSVVQTLAAFERMDMLIHVSVQDLQRNLDRYIRNASSPLDDFAPGWRSVVDGLNTKAMGRRKVLEYWLGLVRRENMQPSQGVEEVTGTKNQHLYWLIFVARHALAIDFWDKIRSVTSQRFLDL